MMNLMMRWFVQSGHAQRRQGWRRLGAAAPISPMCRNRGASVTHSSGTAMLPKCRDTKEVIPRHPPRPRKPGRVTLDKVEVVVFAKSTLFSRSGFDRVRYWGARPLSAAVAEELQS